MSDNSRLVYSSGQGKICRGCGQPSGECVCLRLKKTAVPGTVSAARVYRETKRRKGKGMTVISGLALSPERLSELAKDLKRRLGIGGTVKEDKIELQGDVCEVVRDELAKRGYKLK